MTQKLIIVESPAKSKTIKSFVGPDFEVAASMGHVRDLPAKGLGVDIPAGFQPEYQPIPERRKVLTDLARAVRQAQEVYLASDPDREGEAIAWHLVEALGIRHARRIEFNEITRRAVLDALAHPRDIDLRRVHAQQARRILDRLVGYQISPLLMRKMRRRSLSAGRVQSVAVKLVCEREREIEAFVPEEYWNITATLTPQGEQAPFAARLAEIGGKKAKVTNGEQAQGIVSDLRALPYAVASIKQARQKRNAPAPFITSTLQQEASSRLGMSPKRTMQIAQQLYEGIDVGEGPTGLITYMRTDSTRISAEARAEARELITSRFGAQYVAGARQFKAVKGAQEAHEAVRPTAVGRDPEALVGKLERDQLRLYRLIWARFLASQMAAAAVDVTTVNVSAGSYLLRATGSVVAFPGFLAVYRPEEEKNGAAEEQLPRLQEGQPLDLVDLASEQKFTEPLARYTEASLIKALEAQGIGRPSTYAPILGTIQDRGYVFLESRRLRPTDLGFAVTDQLEAYFPQVMNVQFTAEIEGRLDAVEEGRADWARLLEEFYGPFHQAVENAEQTMRGVRMPARETSEVCEACGRPMVIRTGRRGPFLACTGYPACTHTRPVPGSEAPERPARPQARPTDLSCPQCGKPLVIRTSRRGEFYGCSGFPACRYTKPLEGEQGTSGEEQKCDQCGRPMVLRRSRRGPFWGCSGYPACKNTRAISTTRAAVGTEGETE